MENHIQRMFRLPVNPPLYIGTVADVQMHPDWDRHLVAVALVKALHLMRGERVSDIQIAEKGILRRNQRSARPVGKQITTLQHWRLNVFQFLSSGQVRIEPIIFR